MIRSEPGARWLLTGMAVSALGDGLTLPFLVVYLHAVRGVPLATAGVAIGVAGVVGLVGGLAGGRWVDRFGAARFMIGGLALNGIGTALLAWVTSAPEATAAVALVGVAEGVTWTAFSSLVAVSVGERFRPRAYAAQFLLMNFGIGVGGLVSGSVVSLRSPVTFQAIYLGDAATFFLYIAVMVVALARGGLPLGREGPGERQERASYVAVLSDRTFVALLACQLGFVFFGYAQVDSGFSVFATEVVRVSPRVVGAAFAANCFVIVVVQAWMTSLTESASRARVLAAGALVVALAWGLVGLADLPSLRSTLGAPLLVISLGVFGLGETLESPVVSALVNQLAGAGSRGRYNALSVAVWGMTGVLGPPFATALLSLGVAAAWVGPVVGGSLVTAGAYLALGRPLRVRLAIGPEPSG